jgi:phenylacetate-CoA ligase
MNSIDRFSRGLINTFETKFKGRQTFKYLDELEASQWWSTERIRQLQLDRLRDLLTYCAQNSLHYAERWRRLGFDPRSVASLEDLQQLPVLTRQDVREDRDRIFSRRKDQRVVHKSTGGSSGEPLSISIDLRSNDRRVAAAYRGYSWGGADIGCKQTYLWGVPLGERTRLGKMKEYIYSRCLHRRDVMNCFELSANSTPAFINRINRFHPKVIVAYTNPLYYLARQVSERGLKVHSPQSIIVGAEKLHSFQRRLIEDVFRARVFETYGSREFTLIASECESHGGLHITAENLIVEIVDQDWKPTPEGIEGQILITDLTNYALPLIRYAIGDRGIASSRSCDCGRGLPMLERVVGRQLDIIRTADGKHLAGEFFPHLIKDYAPIQQFQVTQTSIDSLNLRLVTDHRWDDQMHRKLQENIRNAIGPKTLLCIDRVESIPLSPSGKLCVVKGIEAI